MVATLHVRQLVRQTRRLQRLSNLFRHRFGPPRVDALQLLWDAVLGGAGFGTSFPKWFVRQRGWFPTEFPEEEQVSIIYELVKDFTDEASRKAWSMKRQAFVTDLENSCAKQGAALPC